MVLRMPHIATVTHKNMVTSPAAVRRKYDIRKGDRVQFVEVKGAIIILPVKSLSDMHGVDRKHAKALLEGIRELNLEHRKKVSG
jgi:AbrB family looped-hinge helix DNA binding protein